MQMKLFHCVIILKQEKKNSDLNHENCYTREAARLRREEKVKKEDKMTFSSSSALW